MSVTSAIRTGSSRGSTPQEPRGLLRELQPRARAGIHAVIQAERRAAFQQLARGPHGVGTYVGDTVRSSNDLRRTSRSQAVDESTRRCPWAVVRPARARTGSRRAARTLAARRPQTIRRASSRSRTRFSDWAARLRCSGRSAVPSKTKSLLKCTSTASACPRRARQAAHGERVGPERLDRMIFRRVDRVVAGAVDDHVRRSFAIVDATRSASVMSRAARSRATTS